MTALSLAGVAIAVIVLIANLRPWWKSGHNPKDLAPFGWGALLGVLATLCVGGLLGWSAAKTADMASGLGNTVVSKTVGTSAQPVAHGSAGHLTPAGGVVVVIILATVIFVLRSSGKADKRRITGGAFCGAVLGYLPGIAAGLVFVPEAVNSIGAWGASAVGSVL